VTQERVAAGFLLRVGNRCSVHPVMPCSR
jgi:hypothetical protein